MAIFRGPGGSGDATTDSTTQALAATQAAADALASKNAAAASATSASDSATSATNSATTATTQAGIATTKAGEAAASASTASTQASNASASASTATTQATNASNSATAAAASAASASTNVDNAFNAITSTANTLSPGASATSSFNTSTKVLTLGVPTGATGAQGVAGATGATGAKGDKGDTGAGVAAGGTTGQVLAKVNATDYNTTWVTPTAQVYPSAGIPNSTGSAWGTSYGTTGTGSVVLSASPTMTGSVVVSGANSSITVNSLYFGRGVSNDIRNLGLGSNIPYINAGDGRYLTALGTNALANYGNAPLNGNLNNSTAVGYNALANNYDGSDNTAVGYNTGGSNINGTNERNTFIGSKAGLYLGEDCVDNVFLGYNSNPYTTTQIASRCIIIGSNAKNKLSGVYNTVVIGDSAVGHIDNTVTIGNSEMTNTYINGLGFSFGAELPTSGTINGSLDLLTTNNATLSKTINIGTGTSSAFSAINIGAGNYTTTVKGLLKQQTFTVATLPTGSAGARSFVTNALTPTFGAAVVGGGAVGVPVYHDGTSWKVG